MEGCVKPREKRSTGPLAGSSSGPRTCLEVPGCLGYARPCFKGEFFRALTENAIQDFIHLVIRGGWLMIPIGMCSVGALGLFIERLVSTRREAVAPPSLQLNVEGLLARRLPHDAMELCQGKPSPLGRVLAAGIRLFTTDGRASVTRDEVKDALEAAGRRESEDLERFVGALATIATVAPLLGLLGTVLGMVETFRDIEAAETVSKNLMAGGIWVALITTVAGLIVAIPTVIAHRIVTARIKDRVTELEAGAERAAELLLRPDVGQRVDADAPTAGSAAPAQESSTA